MDILYQRELSQNYMILSAENTGEDGTYEKRMVLNNHIDGLLSMDVRKINSEVFYYYKIHSLQSVQTIFEHKLFDRETLLQLFFGIAKVFQELGRYLLSPENLCLKPQCVYMNMETGEIFLCFCPWQKTGKETFEELAEFLIDRVNYGEDDAKELAYAYYEKVCAGEYNPESLIEHIAKTESKDMEMVFSPIEHTKEEHREEFYFVEPEEEERKDSIRLPVIQMMCCMGIILLAAGLYLLLLSNPSILFYTGLSQEDYIVIGAVTAACAAAGMMAVVRFSGKRGSAGQEDREQVKEYQINIQEEELEAGEEYFGETTVLSVEKMYKVAQIRGMDGNEKRTFVIDENPFIIGKLSGKADGILTDSRVSRVHAAVREDSGKYYISDLNSTNGTYVNGKRLNGTETVQLHHMDQIRMASVEMVFLCE